MLPAVEYRCSILASMTSSDQGIKLSQRARIQPGRKAQLAHAASGAVRLEIPEGYDIVSRNRRLAGGIQHGIPGCLERPGLNALTDDLAIVSV